MGHKEIAKKLINDFDADIDLDVGLAPPLTEALRSGSVELVNFLLAKGADITQSPEIKKDQHTAIRSAKYPGHNQTPLAYAEEIKGNPDGAIACNRIHQHKKNKNTLLTAFKKKNISPAKHASDAACLVINQNKQDYTFNIKT